MPADDTPAPAHDLSAYRRVRQGRADHALLLMFADVLGRPLVLREFTAEEQARREARLRARQHRRI